MIRKKYKEFIEKNNLSNSQLREKLAVHSGILGIVCNIVLSVLKLITGALTGSVSITADAVNNLSDAGSGIITIVGAKLSAKPVDKEHPFGHGRLEYISAMVISFFIFAMGFELLKSSVSKIIHPAEIKFNGRFLAILIISVIVKLFMAYYNGILFSLCDNINFKAVRQDSLNDSLSTLAAAISLIAVHLTGIKQIDGIIGLIVSFIVFKSGIEIAKEVITPLIGKPPSAETVNKIESIMLKEELIYGIHDLIVHDYGAQKSIASIHAEVPSTASITEIHNIIDKVEREIFNALKIVICVHMDPILINDEVKKYKKITDEIIHSVNKLYTCHDFRIVKNEEQINLIFDLVIPFSEERNTTEILRELKNKFREYSQFINVIVTIEHS